MDIEWMVIENTWLREFNGKNLATAILPGGWGNGYVILPKEHPCFEMDCNEIYNKYGDVGCELTYAGYGHGFNNEDIGTGKWVVGFDTMHFSDTLEKWPKEEVEKGAMRLRWRMLEIWIMEQRKLTNK